MIYYKARCYKQNVFLHYVWMIVDHCQNIICSKRDFNLYHSLPTKVTGHYHHAFESPLDKGGNPKITNKL